MQPTWTPARFYTNILVLMHWHTGKSLLNTLGRAVEQLAGCHAKQAVEVEVQQPCNTSAKLSYEYLMRCQSGVSPFHGSDTRSRP